MRAIVHRIFADSYGNASASVSSSGIPSVDMTAYFQCDSYSEPAVIVLRPTTSVSTANSFLAIDACRRFFESPPLPFSRSLIDQSSFYSASFADLDPEHENALPLPVCKQLHGMHIAEWTLIPGSTLHVTATTTSPNTTTSTDQYERVASLAAADCIARMISDDRPHAFRSVSRTKKHAIWLVEAVAFTYWVVYVFNY